MTIPAAEIAQVHALLAQGLDKQAIANRLGKTRPWVQRRARKRAVEKPRYRVPVGSFERPPQERPAPLYSPMPAPTPADDEITRVLAIGDLHDDPYIAKDRFRWIGRMIADTAPDRVVQIGDICDLESLSFHSPNDSDSGRYKPRFMADLASLREALDEMFEPVRRMSAAPRFDLTLGNHENRIWRFEETAPETAGMLQRDFMVLVSGYGIAAHKYGAWLRIGGIGFTHAPFSVMGKPIGGMTAAQTVARQATFDVVQGHTHKFQHITSPKVGDDERVTVVDLGCALPQGHVQPYAKHTMTGWTWGVVELLIRAGRIQGVNQVPMFEVARRYG